MVKENEEAFVISNMPLNFSDESDIIFTSKLEDNLLEPDTSVKIEEEDSIETDNTEESVNEVSEDLKITPAPQLDKNYFLEKAIEHIGSNELENLEIRVGEELISATEYIKDLDTLLEVLDSVKAQELESYKSNSVSLENLDQINKDIITIVAKGGNPVDLIKLHTESIVPLSQIDTSTEEGQELAVKTLLELDNLSDRNIKIIIDGYKREGILQEEGEQAEQKLNERFKKEIERVKQDELNKIETIKTKQKEYKKELKKNVIEQLGLNEATAKRLTDFASEVKKMDEGGISVTDMDLVYHQKRNDPKESVLLSLFLENREKYDEWVSKNKVNEVHKDISKKIIIAAKSKTPGSNKSILQAKIDEDREILTTAQI